MENDFSSFFSATKKVINDYLETRLDLFKFQASGRLSKALGVFFTLIMASFLFFFIIIFLGMVLGFWMGGITGSNAIGFLISTLFFAILLTVAMIFRKRLIEKPISNIILTVLSEGIEEEEAENFMEEKL
ncbi:MAG: hypothetical protein ACYCOO_08305 [Chitinophagaceae bacterium]